MNTLKIWITRSAKVLAYSSALVATVLFSCDDEDPKKVNEEEVITTLTATLTETGTANVITLRFYDEDGDGSMAPEYSRTGTIYANKSYNMSLELLNEQESPAEDITLEIEEEKNDHLFCFGHTGSVASVTATDEDDNGLDVGLEALLTTGANGNGTITIKLRHQPDVKTGQCPGAGDTDIEVTFEVPVASIE